MVQNIHPLPRGVFWVPSSRLMWKDQLKKICQQFRPYYIYRSPCYDKFVAFLEYMNFIKYNAGKVRAETNVPHVKVYH